MFLNQLLWGQLGNPSQSCVYWTAKFISFFARLFILYDVRNISDQKNKQASEKVEKIRIKFADR